MQRATASNTYGGSLRHIGMQPDVLEAEPDAPPLGHAAEGERCALHLLGRVLACGVDTEDATPPHALHQSRHLCR